MKIKIIATINGEEFSRESKPTTLENLMSVPKAELHENLSWNDTVEILSTPTKRVFIYQVLFKGTSTSINVSSSGEFSYMQEGKEILIDTIDYDFLTNPQGEYQKEVISQMSFRLIEIFLEQ